MAWCDIKGKLAKMPLYQLLGGKAKDAIEVYRHADGLTVEEVEQNVRKFMAQGYCHIRCQMGLYGGKESVANPTINPTHGDYFEQNAYMRSIVKLFKHLRSTIGNDVHLLHDVHERLLPIQAVGLLNDCKVLI